jgi:hypothetical protein
MNALGSADVGSLAMSRFCKSMPLNPASMSRGKLVLAL